VVVPKENEGMELKPGSRIADDGGTVEVVVIRAPGTDVSFHVTHDPDASGATGEVLLGKRYVDEETGTEVLCSKNGSGFLVLDGRVMEVKQAKPLPSSD
jgi:hypothetical protein